MILSLAAIILVVSTIFIVAGELNPILIVKGNALKIRCLYGRTLKFSDIESVEVVNRLPQQVERTWGHWTGTSLKGKFYDKVKDKHIWIYANHGNSEYLKIDLIEGDSIYIGRYENTRFINRYNNLISSIDLRGKVGSANNSL